MTKYVIRRVRQVEAVDKLFGNTTYDRFVSATPDPRTIVESEYLDEALRFGSKLGAVSRMMTNEPYARGEDRTNWEVVLAAEVKPRPRPYEPPFALARTCPVRTCEEIAEHHGIYCERIERWLRLAGLTEEELNRGRPRAEVVFSAPKWAGVYSPQEHACAYVLPYALMAEDYMERIVPHECVHAYQRAFCGRQTQAHGDDFYALMLRAAKVPCSEHTHPYDVAKAQELAEHARPYLLRQLELGMLASMPFEVDSASLTRERRGAVECPAN